MLLYSNYDYRKGGRHMKKEFVEPKVEVVEIASNCGQNNNSSTTEGVDL